MGCQASRSEVRRVDDDFCVQRNTSESKIPIIADTIIVKEISENDSVTVNTLMTGSRVSAKNQPFEIISENVSRQVKYPNLNIFSDQDSHRGQSFHTIAIMPISPITPDAMMVKEWRCPFCSNYFESDDEYHEHTCESAHHGNAKSNQNEIYNIGSLSFDGVGNLAPIAHDELADALSQRLNFALNHTSPVLSVATVTPNNEVAVTTRRNSLMGKRTRRGSVDFTASNRVGIIEQLSADS